MSADRVTENGRMSRRDLLFSMGLQMAPAAAMAVGTAAATGTFGLSLPKTFRERVRPPKMQEAPDPGGGPYAIHPFPLVVVMSEKLHLRGYPAIPEPGRPSALWRKVDNVIPWSKVQKINGVPVEGFRQVIIEGAETVLGQNTFNLRSQSSTEEWIRLLVDLRGEASPQYAFLSYGLLSSSYTGTEDYIWPVGAYYSSTVSFKDAQRYGAGYMLKDGQWLSEARLGRVTPVSGWGEYYDVWRRVMEGKLDGETLLSPYQEERHERVKVTRGSEPVQNLIRLTSYPDIGNARFRTLGFVPDGVEIENVIRFRDEWGIFRRRDLGAEVRGVYSQPLEVDPDQIIVIPARHIVSATLYKPRV